MAHHLREGRHRADLEAAVALADALQFRNTAQIDDVAGPLDAVLQPVEAVETAGEDPCVGAVAIEQVQRVRRGGGLKQLEGRHHVSYYRHRFLLGRLKAAPTISYVGAGFNRPNLVRRGRLQPAQRFQTCACNGSCMRFLFSSDIKTISAVTGARRNTSTPTASA